MSYKSKRTLTSIIAGILIIAAYIIFALGKNSPETENIKSWAVAMLVFIGIGIAAIIVIMIIFHILFAVGVAIKEQGCDDKEIERIIASSTVEDEMEKLINLKSARIGSICAGIGLVAALVLLAVGMSAVLALHVIVGAFAISSFIEGIAQIYFYENGIK
jgi:hypothetical protein